MVKLSESDLQTFREAILKDYGVKLEEKELYDAAFNLLHFIETLIKFSENDKTAGSKGVQDNPLITSSDNDKMK